MKLLLTILLGFSAIALPLSASELADGVEEREPFQSGSIDRTFEVTPLIDATTSDSSRSRGEIVMINGVARPDLVDQFDLIKSHTVMIRGTVFAKEKDGTLVIPEDVKQETLALLEQEMEEQKNREREVLKSPTTKRPCMRCPACGEPGLCTYSSHFVAAGCGSSGHYSCEKCPGGNIGTGQGPAQ